MTDEPTVRINAEQVHFRTLFVDYACGHHRRAILFEKSSTSDGGWISTTDFDYWEGGEPITAEQRAFAIIKLNEWGNAQGWSFGWGLTVDKIDLDKIPGKDRAFVKFLKESMERSRPALR